MEYGPRPQTRTDLIFAYMRLIETLVPLIHDEIEPAIRAAKAALDLHRRMGWNSTMRTARARYYGRDSLLTFARLMSAHYGAMIKSIHRGCDLRAAELALHHDQHQLVKIMARCDEWRVVQR